MAWGWPWLWDASYAHDTACDGMGKQDSGPNQAREPHRKVCCEPFSSSSAFVLTLLPLPQLVRPGGVIAFDNVLWYGQVADAGATDARTEAIRELNSFLLADERILFSLLPIGDGLALCTKK